VSSIIKLAELWTLVAYNSPNSMRGHYVILFYYGVW